MPRPRFQKLPAERRTRILEAAAREFAVHGYDGATLNHILEEAGLSKGAAYYYFDDKEDLFRTVVQHYWDHILGDVHVDIAQLTAESFWPTIAELHRQNLWHCREQPWMLALAKLVTKPAERAHLLDEGGADPILNWLRALLEYGQKLGVVRTDLPLDLLQSLVVSLDDVLDRWMLERWESFGQEDMDDLVPMLTGIMRRLLAPLPLTGMQAEAPPRSQVAGDNAKPNGDGRSS